ncbi:MAG: NAD(+)--dinitrogen-reductase ADP-D-ribosyltransferase [Pseudomonadota bacterium]
MPRLCRNDDKAPTLPKSARLPINRCNLPAVILGSLTFQRHPTPLVLDGVAELHRDLFQRFDRLKLVHQRAEVFRDYMTIAFTLEHPEEIGLTENVRKSRARANWMRVLRGWAFDPDGREAAVLKGWVESRFGLTPRHHGGELHNPDDAAYRRYEQMRAEGLYGTNALEAQLDLVFAYCQYEFARQGAPSHLTLYRGVNRVDAHELLGDAASGRRVLLLNNISSFSRERERAGEFGDYILEVAVPVAKVPFHCGLLPGVLQGEGEYLVIGGAYEVSWTMP